MNWSGGVPQGYDVVGDVHGHAAKLVELLEAMGYALVDDVWSHSSRQALFVGDLIDRGPQQVETVAIVRSMVEAGTAQIVLGNHEFNAIAWATEDPENPGRHLRAHSEKNTDQHREYLQQVGEGSDLHRAHLDWFMTIPLWLDLGDLRVVHACWDPNSIAVLAEWTDGDDSLTRGLVEAASREGSAEHRATEHLLKGPEIAIPEPYLDAGGHRRSDARLRWWLADAADSLRRAAMIPGGTTPVEGRAYPPLPDVAVDRPLPVAGYQDPVPVFYGHYWETGAPTISGPRTACVDYSVAKGGPLVAYRWQGEQQLTDDHFVSTSVDPPVP